MRIVNIRALTGANVYSHHPVMVMQLDLENLKGKESHEVSGFNVRLLDLLPNLSEHYCTLGKPGGFIERLHEGTHFNHVIEHIAIELLAQAGIGDRKAETCNGDEKDDSKAIIETTAVETTRYILPVAAEAAEALLTEKSFFLEEKIIEAKDITADTELGPSGRAIIKAAERRGIPWSRENEYSLVQLGYGKNLHLVQAAMSDETSAIAVEFAGDKDFTKERLAKFSLPVPDGKVVRSEHEAIKAFETLGAPVVVKPLDGRQGKGVSLNLTAPAEVARAFQIAQEFSPQVLVEEQFSGKNYRVLVINGKMIAASERVACQVVGNGVQTIAELIETENRNPLRGMGHEKPLTKIKINQILLAAIQKAGLRLKDVPKPGQEIVLCSGMNLSTGGTAKDVTDAVHSSIKLMCERAARVIGLDICGVDLVLEDISAGFSKGGIIELNAAPGLRMHTHPSEGKSRDVGGAIVEMLYPNDAPARIPIITITGTNGKTTVTRMISHVLQETHLNIGTTTTDGIYINGKTIVKGDTTGPVSAKTILGDKSIDIAVLETARGGILRRGLGYDWSDVAVVTNITADHLGQDGIETVEDLANIKVLIAERVRAGGTLILNADDRLVAAFAERESVTRIPKKIVYFSFDENNPVVQKHLSTGGTAYFVRDNWIVEATESETIQIVEPARIPATMNGAADYQTQNAMAATAACRAHGILPGKIKTALGEFQNDANNPGRTNFYRVGTGYALVDYGHNPAAFAAVCRMASHWKDKCVTGIIGVPGDRNDALIKESGRVAAAGFDRIIIKEDVDPRGRKRGEVAELLCETATKESPTRECSIVIDEISAFENELKNLNEKSVVVIFYDQLQPVLEVLAKHDAVPVAGMVHDSATTTAA